MRITAFILLAGTALLALPVAAQTTAQPAGDAADAVAAGEGEIVVYGRGETQQVQELDAAALTILASGTSPLKAIEKLPGVNFQSADAFGTYEWSQRISIRGFNQQQLGFTLDGIPLGNAAYGNVNGLHISRAITPENIGTTRVAQGAGSLGTQATNNLGGTIEFISRDPDADFGLKLAGTGGSDETYRGLISVDSGDLGGVRGYASYVYFTTDKWKGFGKQLQQNVNAKLVGDVGDAKITGYFAFSDRAEQDYQDLNLEVINRLGYDTDNITNNYALAVLLADIGANRGETGATRLNPAAGTVYPAPYLFIDDVYYDASGLRRDYVASLGLETPLGENLKFAIKGYFHDNHGQGTWFTPYVPSPSGTPISVRTTEYDITRKGLFGTLTGEFGANTITVGAWYEKNDFHQARRFYGLTSRTEPGRSARKFQTNPFFTQWEFDFDTSTFKYNVQDVIELGDAKVSIGWKGFKVTNTATPLPGLSDGRAAGKIKSEDWFQPSVGVTYDLGPAEVFANFSQSVSAFTSATTNGPFSTTQAGFNAIQNTLKPESSDTYEAGIRYNNASFNGVAGVYLVNFQNRLLGLATGAGIVGNPAILQNVGNVRSYGFEAAGDVKVGAGVSLYASYSYTNSKYRNNVVNALGTIVAATAGKTTVDTPQHLIKGEIAYEGFGFYGRVGANYMSKRFFNYENDRSVPGRVIVDATIGYRFEGGFLDKWELQGNATNLFDKDYVATIGSNGFGNRGDNQTLLSGAPQQFFVTLRTQF